MEKTVFKDLFEIRIHSNFGQFGPVETHGFYRLKVVYPYAVYYLHDKYFFGCEFHKGLWYEYVGVFFEVPFEPVAITRLFHKIQLFPDGPCKLIDYACRIKEPALRHMPVKQPA